MSGIGNIAPPAVAPRGSVAAATPVTTESAKPTPIAEEFVRAACLPSQLEARLRHTVVGLAANAALLLTPGSGGTGDTFVPGPPRMPDPVAPRGLVAPVRGLKLEGV